MTEGALRSDERASPMGRDEAEAVGGVVVARYGDNPLAVINNVKEKLDEIAAGKLKWKKMIADFYKPFHKKVSSTEKVERSSVGRSRELGVSN